MTAAQASLHHIMTSTNQASVAMLLPSITADERVLQQHLKALDMVTEVGQLTSSLSLQDIMAQMSQVKHMAAEEKLRKQGTPPYVPPGGWKQDPTKSLTIGSSKPVFIPSSQDHSIARFHLPPPKWDRSADMDPLLKKALYRIPCRDPSGKIFFSVERDSKGDKIFDTSSSEVCNYYHTFFSACHTYSYIQFEHSSM